MKNKILSLQYLIANKHKLHVNQLSNTKYVPTKHTNKKLHSNSFSKGGKIKKIKNILFYLLYLGNK